VIPDTNRDRFLYISHCNLEPGRSNPSIRTLVKVANAFGIVISELRDGGRMEREALQPVQRRGRGGRTPQ
jgi:hypothetical protein